MSAWIRVLGEELRLLRREGFALWALVGLVVLLVAAALNGRALLAVQTRAAAQLETDAASLLTALSEQAGRGVATATAPGAVGFSLLSEPAVLPPAPLAALAIGQNDMLPSRYLVTARGAYSFMGRTELDNSLRLAVGNFDAAFVIVWLLPLVVIALTFNIVSGERERGVFAIAATAGASVSRFILTKCASRALIICAALWVALLAAALASGANLTRLDSWASLLAWILAATLYAGFWLALALFVNSQPRASDQNASLLAGVWLLLVILAPALTNLAATTAFAAPSRVALTTELREATEAADRAAAADRDRYFFDHPEMRGGEMDTTAYYRSVAQSEANVARAMAPLLEQFELQSLRQQQLVGMLQFLSPGTLSYQLLTGLAGSDGSRHREFRQQTLEFHQRWVAFFSTRLASGARLTTADYAALPQFRFRGAALGATLRRTVLPLLVTLSVTLLLLVVAVRRLRRFPVV